MDPIKKKYHYPADLKQDLLERGIAIIQKNGIEGLTLKSLAGSLGVTSAAMYHHYPDKTALLVAIVERRLNELEVELTTKAYAPFADDIAKMFVKTALVFFDFCEEHREFLALISGDSIGHWKTYPVLAQKIGAILAPPMAALTKGQSAGSIRSGSPLMLTLMMCSGAYGFLNIIFNGKTDLPAEVTKNARRTFFEVVCGSVVTLKTAPTDALKSDMHLFERTFVS